MRETNYIKKTRKEHICNECEKVIPKGSACTEEVDLWGGGVDRWYVCNACENFKDWVHCELDKEDEKASEMEAFNTCNNELLQAESEELRDEIRKMKEDDTGFEYEFESQDE